MPNRMFDPVANPFAVQNLLVEENPTFAVAPDERSEFRFESDPLISGEDMGAFALDEVIELADLTGATGFAAEARASSAFRSRPAAAAADATMAAPENTFTADAATAAQGATGFTEPTEQDETVAAAQPADDPIVPNDDAEAVAVAPTEAETLAASSRASILWICGMQETRLRSRANTTSREQTRSLF